MIDLPDTLQFDKITHKRKQKRLFYAQRIGYSQEKMTSRKPLPPAESTNEHESNPEQPQGSPSTFASLGHPQHEDKTAEAASASKATASTEVHQSSSRKGSRPQHEAPTSTVAGSASCSESYSKVSTRCIALYRIVLGRLYVR